jgi:murein DD-endopeptidase MepM/ murein hydrolase activator NlpD
MGKSGRSTGIHVHYEILVNGKPRNPAKFMEAGKHVLEGY